MSGRLELALEGNKHLRAMLDARIRQVADARRRRLELLRGMREERAAGRLSARCYTHYWRLYRRAYTVVELAPIEVEV